MKTFSNLKLKTSSFFLLFISFAITLTSCHEEKGMRENTNEITKADIDFLKSNHIIPLKDAVKSYKKYGKDRTKILKDTLKKKYGKGFSDSRSVWFDIKTIKAYLKHIEDTSKDSIEGLQFYFTVDLDSQGNKKNHQAFFVAPTQKNGKKQSGFTIVDGKTKFLYEAFKEYKDSGVNVQKGSFFSLMQGEDSLLLNYGEPNPPGNNN